MPVDIHDRAALEDLRRAWRLQPHTIKRLRNAFYKQGAGAAAALAELPAGLRNEAESTLRFHVLELVERRDSADGATKCLLRTADELVLESVILRRPTGRTALCLSSQIGCAAGCRFCATGMAGIRRNLSASEIVDQVVRVHELLRVEGRRVDNLVFMGMGEPFHNPRAVFDALDTMLDSACFDHPARRISVSTVGIPEAMVECARRYPKVRLALSLHAARSSVRERLMPLNARYSVDVLRSAVREVNAIQGVPVMIEYLMLDGVNDSADDLEALVSWSDGLNVQLNLIPFNAVPGIDAEAGLRPTPRDRREEFGAALRARGFPVTLRYSMGGDVAGACGQLAGQSVGQSVGQSSRTDQG